MTKQYASKFAVRKVVSVGLNAVIPVPAFAGLTENETLDVQSRFISTTPLVAQ
jgi:hypothetical protein